MRSEGELRVWKEMFGAGTQTGIFGMEREQGNYKYQQTSMWQNDLLFWLKVLKEALKSGADLNSPFTKMNKN